MGDLVGEVTGDVLRSVIGAHGDAARDISLDAVGAPEPVRCGGQDRAVVVVEQWRERALAALDAGLKDRAEDDPVQAGLGSAYKRLGELGMEKELLREKIARQRRREARSAHHAMSSGGVALVLRPCASTAGVSWSVTASRSPSAAAKCPRSSSYISSPRPTPSPNISWDTRSRP